MNSVIKTVLLGVAGLLSTAANAYDCQNLADWQGSEVYVGGQEVRHANNAYRANWWTQNQNPLDNSDQYQVWTLLGACDGSPQNLPPVANLNGPYSADVNQTIAFSSAGSTDSDGTITSYSWSFGDGASSSQANPSHSYISAGTYTLTLTVTDDDGASHTVSGVATISGGTGGGGGSCDGLPSYVAGTSYAAGDHVVNYVNSVAANVEFVCDIAGWCSSGAGAWAYEPGNGAHWEMAWTEVGECGGTGGGNEAPVADANGPYSAAAGDSINFSSAGSNDPDGQITAYSWSFGDGNTSTQANPSHSYSNGGSYTVTLTVTDDEGASAMDSTVATISGGGNPGSPLPHRALVGYWHNFINQAGYLPIAQVSDDWDIVNISFAENDPFGAAGEMAFAPAEESEASFIAGVQALQARGAKVLISIGGANAHIQLNSQSETDNFVRTMGDIIAQYGFDGMDIDLEGGSLNMNPGDTVANPQTPAIVNLISATRQIKSRFGSDFVLTMAPETAYVQGGYANFGGIWGAYLPLIHALRDDLDLLHVQHYNTGSITGADDVTYLPGTADFHVALSDMMITGFPAGRDNNNYFPGLRSDQMAFGLPATAGAASSGQTDAATVHRALDCLIKRQQCGSYAPAQARSDFRGLMTWSINWDVFGGGAFSTPHRNYLDSNP